MIPKDVYTLGGRYRDDDEYWKNEGKDDNWYRLGDEKINSTVVKAVVKVEGIDSNSISGLGMAFGLFIVRSFYNTPNIKSIEFSGSDLSRVTEMGNPYWSIVNGIDAIKGNQEFRKNLRSVDFSNSNLTNLTDMHGMFYLLSGLEKVNLSGVDTSKVTDMSNMFGGCYSLTNLDVSKFDTRNVTDMGVMFGNCETITLPANIQNDFALPYGE